MDSNSLLKSHLEGLCEDVITEKQWNSFRDIDIHIIPSLLAMGAFITLDKRKIHVSVAEDLYEAIDIVRKKEKLDIEFDDFLEKMMYFIVVHEYSHHRDCPRTKEDFERMLEGSFEAINKIEYNINKIQSICTNVHNLVSDTILNTINSHNDPQKEKYRDGISLFYLLMSNYNKRKLNTASDKAGTLFLSSNLLSCKAPVPIQEKIEKYYPWLFLGFNRKRKQLINVFTGDEDLTKAIIGRDVSQEGIDYLVGRIKDKGLWKQMCYDYTKIIYPYMKQRQEWQDNSFSKDEPESSESGKSPQDNMPEQGQKSPKKKPQEKDDPKKDSSPKEGNKDKKEGKEDKKESGGAKGKEDKKKNKGLDDYFYQYFKGLLAKEEAESSPHLMKFRKLDYLYTQRAGRIALFTEEESNHSPHYEKLMATEEMPLEEFSLRNIDWSSTKIIKNKDGTKNIEFYRGAVPLVLPFEAEEKSGGLVDLSFIFDSSISMGFEPFEGKGEYHLAVLSFYSILNFLEEQGLAPLINYNVMNFSKKTIGSGWCNYWEMNKVKRTLFDYQGHATILESEALADLRDSRRDNFISFMLTDSDFNFKENELEILEEIDKIQAAGGIGLYLFQMGPPTSFSKALETRKIPVLPIESAEDFMEISIAFTKELYGEVVKKCL